ncbi:proline and serine-rich protein 3 isoform X1 [Gadus morhua]|uniref:proline and serine-rich protein 3 isoform X1 n=1 Tax=Gadus morhua TaxID=8049 RepID=UPI0011B43BD1|nr:proline and serine-rich protein 3 isoform X1 [Gadus morhua]XP_030225243.1 proline and serine-rich protein 3 isoform X1 [Gadus morhua]
MKSSVAVFTREDPLPPLPSRKTGYHPSRRQNLTQKKSSKKTPADDRPAWPSTDQGSPSSETAFPSNTDPPGPSAGGFNMSPPHQQDSVLARYVQRFRYGEPRSRAERRPVSPAAEREEARLFWWMSPSSPPSSPTPRDSGDMDETAALKEDQDPGRGGELGTSRPYGEPLDISSLDLSDSSLGDRWDIEGVQERASRLLQRSESSVSSGSLVVSSEGLGGSGLSSPVSANEPFRRPFFPCPIEPTACNTSSSSAPVGPSQNGYTPSASISRQRPEEDILFQWRLRRKMEQASHWPPAPSQPFPSLHQQQPPSAWQNPTLHQPPSAWQNPTLHQPPPAGQTSSLHQASVSGSMEHMPLEQRPQDQGPEPSQRTPPSILPTPQHGRKGTHGPCPPAAGPPSTSTPRPASSQTASSHQPAREPPLWDGFPGPVPSSFPTTPPKALGRPPTDIAPKHSRRTVTNPSPAAGGREPESCPPPPSSSEPTKDERNSDIKEQKTAHRKQKRRPAGDGPGPQIGGGSRPRPDSMAASAPQRLSPDKDTRQRKSQALHQGVCSAQCAPPSPVHLALRQAVSEVLFPTRRASSSSSVPPRGAPAAPPRPQGPDGSAQPPEEVLSQLLRDAEDSDGAEFGDDGLLQVLRKQRTRVKDQISQVDSLLEEFTPVGEEA